MNTLLDVSPVPPIGAGELLLLFACCGVFLLGIGGAVGLVFLMKRKKG